MTASQFEWADDLPLGLEWCESCGEPRGVAWHEGQFRESVCLCQGPLCRVCGITPVRRPISDYWNIEREAFIHVPWFYWMQPCDACSALVGDTLL